MRKPDAPSFATISSGLNSWPRGVELLSFDLRPQHGFSLQDWALLKEQGQPLNALVVIGELCEIKRFCVAHPVGVYAGLTSRVRQSGDHCYYGKITRQASPWSRRVLVKTAFHVVRRDHWLRDFCQQARKRAGSNKARVAMARKLAEICWIRLRRCSRQHATKAA